MPDLHEIDELDIAHSSWTLVIEKEVSLLTITKILTTLIRSLGNFPIFGIHKVLQQSRSREWHHSDGLKLVSRIYWFPGC